MAFLMGLSIPTYSLIFGDIMATMAETSIDKIREDVFLYAMLFVAMGIVSGIVAFLQLYLFGVCGERLTMRLRRMVFTAMLQQEVGWYDEQENSTGALCSRLSADASAVQGAAGSRMSTLCQAASTLCAGIIIAMIYNWKLGLVMIGFTPFVIAATYFQMKILSGQVSDDKKSQEEASRVSTTVELPVLNLNIAVEAITCIRTVASLHQENTFLTNYTKALETRFEKSKIKAHMRGITFGVAQSLGNFSYAVALFYGCRLIVDQELTYGDLFKLALEKRVPKHSYLGPQWLDKQSVTFAPDYQKGRLAAVHIFKLLDRLPKICVNQSTGDMPDVCDGNVRFEDLEFTYPTRPNVKILNGLSFDVGKGQTVADHPRSPTPFSYAHAAAPSPDRILRIMDNKNIVNLNIPWLRRKLGIVSQEPVLFGYSIADNIAYGDNSRTVSLNEVIRASERANIHSFIKSLPMGYDTPVGDKGTQLSGGQKQRIAIARALVRDPQILLLDEATSALDSESEKVVQQALDEAREGRTCIVIAHRLSTIQNADKIVVVSKGVVVEEGRHQELIAKRGAYYDLYNVQNLMH
ncbi:unnamed protein product [Oppiella nova]|uniref:ABC-type xenobiotic transporter n=3 Tax=Oppiella nova TaxID=334625 RepID=A0A7R9M0G5_9ACAR|nr:unnamed protein product [Oppiella nova]CAG2168716.1 unnamed protein product [Oppiella nova]